MPVWKQLENPNLQFPEILYSDRNLETEKRDRNGFSRKTPVCTIIDKKDPKQAQNRGVFLIFIKCHHYLLEVMTLQFSVFLCNPCIWENSGF